MITKFFENIKIVQAQLIAFLLLLFPAALMAQTTNGVKVENFLVGSGVVTFDVSWDENTIPPEATPWSDTVWVFVDYNNNGVMTRLPLNTSGATLTATSAPDVGKVISVSGNDQGVWVVGNAKDQSNSSGSFSATVELLYDVATNVAGACAYASNYPPVGEWKEDGSGVSFTGTPNYTIWLTHGGTASSVTSGKDFIVSPGYVITAFTDKTGAPGTFLCIPPAAPVVAKGEFCYEQSGELVASVSGSVTIKWYDAPTGGTLLHSGNVLSLPPLYNASAQYYAQAVAEGNCRSVRVKADYTVSNCTISGDCPNYTAGNVGANTTPVACAAHYAGQITGSSASSACVVHDAGRIGGGSVTCNPPTAPTSIGASTLTAYVGQVVTLTATGGDNGSGAQYEWGTGAAGTGSGVKTTANTYQVSPAMTTDYWVRRVSTIGCGLPTAVVTATVTTNAYHPDYPESEVCPGYVIGSVDTSGTSGAVGTACAAHYAGQIGSNSASCVVHDAGRIGN
jgi:hypothetical protein